MRTKLLWIGANSSTAEADLIEEIQGHAVVHESSITRGLELLNTGGFCLVILDVSAFPDSGENALEQVLHHDRRFPVIVHNPDGTIDDAIRLTRHGAFYVLLGEIEFQRLEHAVKMALDRCRLRAHADADALPWRRSVIGQSRPMQHILDVIQLVAPKRVTVLINGETGTGKEVVAKAIHAASTRSSRQMVSVNCTALPANLIETELFGHAKGAFTGAHGSRIGRFEQANRSTIFLDEVGDLPLEAQAKLLRVLQEQEFQRVGSSETVRVDVRVVAATNVNLEEAVRERKFREDLFYRLNVVPIRIPPLRERREDIPALVDFFLEKIHESEGGPSKRISPEAVDLLTMLDWPGNVRQLEHAVHSAFALSGDRRILFPGDFSTGRVAIPQQQQPVAAVVASRPAVAEAVSSVDQPNIVIPKEGIDFDEVVSGFELSLLNQALAASGGNKARAADLLRIKRTTLLAKMKALEERNAAPARKGPVPVPSRPTALVLEQDAGVRKLITKTLEQDNYRVLEASSASSAHDLFETWKTHISLAIAGASDTPIENTVAELRRAAPSLPMVIVSGDSAAHIPNLDRTTTDVLARPFSTEDLRTSIKELTCVRSRAGAYCA